MQRLGLGEGALRHEAIPGRVMSELENETWKERKPRKGTLMSKLLQRVTRAQFLWGLCRILRIVSQRGKEVGVFIDQFLNLFG